MQGGMVRRSNRAHRHATLATLADRWYEIHDLIDLMGNVSGIVNQD